MAPSNRLSVTAAMGAAALLLLCLAAPAAAHEHGEDHIPEGETISVDPIDTTLWVHILLMMFVFGILYPFGMVLGIIKSRWHVPVQVLATALGGLGYVLGHMHGGRQFVHNNVHAKAAKYVVFIVLGQIVIGIYLRLHLERGLHARIRPYIRMAHGVLGKGFPIMSWAQMIFGGITALGFCQGDHVGQCAAHFIMGGAFVAYGIILTILLVVGQVWQRRSGRSAEFFDSCVIAAWGCVNTFTEHRWGTRWVKNDWQHTTMGIIWWSAGLAGIWLSRSRDGRPQRNFIPAFVILITGWAMSAHPQELHVSEATHSLFGYTLMMVGVTRIIEISIILRDKTGINEDGTEYNSFQYIPVFLMYAAGFLFMGATEEQMLLVAQSDMDHVAYILILYSIAFLVFLFVNVLIHIYDRSANAELLAAKAKRAQLAEASNTTTPSGHRLLVNGHARTESRQVRDAEEFELGDMTSDDDDDDLDDDDNLNGDSNGFASRRKLLKQEDDEESGLMNGHANSNGNGNGHI